MTYYSTTIIITIWFMVMMIIHLKENEIFSKREKHFLKIAAFLIIIATSCEFIGIELDGKMEVSMICYDFAKGCKSLNLPIVSSAFSVFVKGLATVFVSLENKFGATIVVRICHKLVKTFEFTVAPVIPFLLACVLKEVDNNKGEESQQNEERKFDNNERFYMCIIMLNILFEFSNLFYSTTFLIDEANRYMHSNYYWFYVCIFTIGIVYAVVELVNYGEKHQTANTSTLISMILLLFIELGIRVSNYGIYTDWLVVSLEYGMFVVVFADISLKTDSLTGLLNRGVYDNHIAGLKGCSKNHAIVFIDANKFKSINDTYGHDAGDEAIRRISKRILKSYRKYGQCFRFGGDEFAVILNFGKKLNKLQQQRELIVSLETTLIMGLTKESKIYPMLKQGVSIGYGILSEEEADDCSSNIEYVV